MTNLSMPRCDIEELKGQIEQLKEENQKLKKLLKEYRSFLCEGKHYGLVSYHKNDILMMLERVDKAIGEKK